MKKSSGSGQMPPGNRNDATVCDILNRATTIGGVSRTYDILGNTTGIGSSKSMTWDVLNRMATLNNGTAYTYAYRADGMRVTKSWGSGLSAYKNWYRYDGQMPVEEYDTGLLWPTGTHLSLLKYGLGARGIDRIERDSSDSSTVIGYPLYDAPGNNVATLQKGSGNTYAPLSDLRGYDAWGRRSHGQHHRPAEPPLLRESWPCAG